MLEVRVPVPCVQSPWSRVRILISRVIYAMLRRSARGRSLPCRRRPLRRFPPVCLSNYLISSKCFLPYSYS